MLAAERTRRPSTYSGIAQRVSKVCEKISVQGASFHRLRKNAIIALAEAVCTVSQIKVITRHSTDSMVAHYSRKAEQRRLTRAEKNLLNGNAHGNASD